MPPQKQNPASGTRGARRDDLLDKSIARDNTPKALPDESPRGHDTDDAALLSRRGVTAVGPADPNWFDKLLEGNDPAEKLILIQQRSPDTPALVTYCGESSGFAIAEEISFGLALQIGLEAVRRGAELEIEIEGGP